MMMAVSMGTKSMPSSAVPEMNSSRVSWKVVTGRITVKAAALQPSTTTVSPRNTGASPMLAEAWMLAPLDSNDPASRITMDSRAVSVPSAMARRMW